MSSKDLPDSSGGPGRGADADRGKDRGGGIPLSSGAARAGSAGARGAARVGSFGRAAGAAGAGDLARGGGSWLARLSALVVSNPVLMMGLTGSIALAGMGSMATGFVGALGQNQARSSRVFARRDAAVLAALPRTNLHGGDRNSSLMYVGEPNAGALGGGAEASAVSSGGAAGGGSGKDATRDAAKNSKNGAQAPAQPGPNAAADAAAGQGTQPGGFGRNRTLGGGLSGLRGGAGLSGGIGQSFAKLTPRGGPDGEPSASGQLQAMSHPGAVSRSAAAKRAATPGSGRGANLRRLTSMNGAIRPTGSMSNLQQASAIQTQQWSSAQPDGQAATGAGAKSGAGVGGGQSVDGPGVNTGPITSPASRPAAQTAAPAVGRGVNVTPWQAQVDLATALITAASILLLLAFLIGMAAKAGWITAVGGVSLYAIAKWLSYAAMTLAGIVALIGIAIMAQGQMLQGGIFTAVGALMTGLAFLAADGYGKAADAMQTAEKLATDMFSVESDVNATVNEAGGYAGVTGHGGGGALGGSATGGAGAAAGSGVGNHNGSGGKTGG